MRPIEQQVARFSPPRPLVLSLLSLCLLAPAACSDDSSEAASGGAGAATSGGGAAGAGEAGTAAGAAGTAGTAAGTAGTAGGTAGTAAGTAGTAGGTAGTAAGTAGTAGGTAAGAVGTAGAAGGTAGTAGADAVQAGAAGASAGASQGGAAGAGAAGAGAAGAGAAGAESLTGGLIGGTEHYSCAPPEGEMPELQLTPYVTTGLELPIYVTHAPNETNRLFVLEQSGVIKVVKEGIVNPEPFLDITANVSIDPWEQGLLGLAFHPDYEQNGLFYIHFNSMNLSGYPDQAGVVAEYQVSADNPDVADPSSQRILLSVDTDRGGEYLGYHNGGSIFFGLEGELFIALGDGAGRGPGEASNNAQDLSSLRGTLSRIFPLQSGDSAYTIPDGNLADEMPMAGGLPVAPEIWSYGLRNPYRTNMDPCTGDIYFGDVGHFDFEEVDVEPTGTGHHNYGWPVYEGDTCLLDPACESPAQYRDPVVVYSHNGGSGAVIGGAVYRGSAIPALRGTYFFSDLYGGTRTFRYDNVSDAITVEGNGSVEEQTNANQEQQTIVAIQPGGDGELYFVGRGGSTAPDGPLVSESVIYKLEPYVP